MNLSKQKILLRSMYFTFAFQHLIIERLHTLTAKSGIKFYSAKVNTTPALLLLENMSNSLCFHTSCLIFTNFVHSAYDLTRLLYTLLDCVLETQSSSVFSVCR